MAEHNGQVDGDELHQPQSRQYRHIAARVAPKVHAAQHVPRELFEHLRLELDGGHGPELVELLERERQRPTKLVLWPLMTITIEVTHAVTTRLVRRLVKLGPLPVRGPIAFKM